MYTEFKQLSDEQVEKLPWNRLKNIMKSVRAVISSIEHYHGQYYCSDAHIDKSLYKHKEDRDIAVEQILQPLNDYFATLKLAASKLPHELSRKKK